MGSHQIFASRYNPAPPVGSPQTFTYASDGDTNGLFYFLGRNFNTIPWENPHTAGRVVVQNSSILVGTLDFYVNRESSGDIITNNTPNSWVSVDVGSGQALVVNDYTLQNRGSNGADNSRAIRNWILQGSNDAASNSISDIAAATWVDIDTRVNDTTMATTSVSFGNYSGFSVPAAYRWFRIYQNGVNAFGSDHLAISEIELYGVFTF